MFREYTVTRCEFAHVVVALEDVEAIHDLFGTGPAPNVQEVGRGASVKLDDVHRCHGEPSTVHCGEGGGGGFIL